MPPIARDFDVGLRLRVWDHEGPGPLVVCVHGYLDTGRSFDEVARVLDGDARVLAVDLRGHGGSARVGPGGSYHLLDHVKDIARLLPLVDVELGEVAALVGHSMGGNVALLVAGCVPERVRRLLLVDSLGPPSEPADAQPARIGAMLRALGQDKAFRAAASLDDALDRIQATNPGLSREGARRMMAPVLVPDDDGGLAFPFDPALRGPVPFRFPEAFWLALAASVTGPSRVVRASDGYVSLDEPFAARAAALRAPITTIEDVGHHLHVERPDALAREVRALLATPRSPSA